MRLAGGSACPTMHWWDRLQPVNARLRAHLDGRGADVSADRKRAVLLHLFSSRFHFLEPRRHFKKRWVDRIRRERAQLRRHLQQRARRSRSLSARGLLIVTGRLLVRRLLLAEPEPAAQRAAQRAADRLRLSRLLLRLRL